ncbi:MAG TPA: RIO1 family regulatory kinase/ATPase [Kofleriaceae bacterium]|jgi:RIO kinase 1|nr:RIO1 family regulatory kinase/ATPase [Kofleriaceae bacterium]
MSDPLDVLLSEGVIDEVLGRLKSGKEANISLVRRGDGVLAAKVYKDRATRSFKNNADYKEGRKVRNTRTQRAVDSGGRFGRDAAEQAWKSAEADALYRLVGSGVRVPAPVMFYEGVLLMELVTDGDGRPAPRMIDVALDPAAALAVYADLVAQIIAMLCCDLIHGDLSPYNILAAADGPTIIDFPQVVSAVHSSRAEFFFLRDFDNVVRFVAGFDPALAAFRHDGRAIWQAYVSRELTREFVPPPPPPPRQQASHASAHRRQEPRVAPAANPRPGNRRQPQPQDPRWSGAPRRDDPRSERAPYRSSRPPLQTTPPRVNTQRPASPDPRRPADSATGTSQNRPPRDNRPPQTAPPDRARSANARGPALPQPLSSREAAGSPPPARGRRRRPKRHW